MKKKMEEHVIAMEGSNIPFLRKPRSVISDSERLEKVTLSSLALCLVLVIFFALKISRFGDKFMTKHESPISIIVTSFVLYAQISLLGIIVNHPVNKSIFVILFMLLPLTATSVIIMIIVSWIAAITIFISWMIVIATIVYINWEEIFNVNIVVLNTFGCITATICLISLLWNFYCMLDALHS
ncbi:hypothetical protein KIW84_011974 [Lathyrus oleraceus]|uniref:Uncharacterized protein n=2 Tax=Pisum sativum TaxID=3888 RepID=A0A9D5BGD0_PEA|nr:hypothetical protein KIW84_011974 [Pisum sativum]